MNNANKINQTTYILHNSNLTDVTDVSGQYFVFKQSLN
jgi:hypothetical protein